MSKVPDVALLNMQYDWDAYFKPYLIGGDILHGFTTTKGDPAMVRAFKVARTPSGTVQVFFKKSASLVAEWCGVDGKPGSEG